MQKGTVLTVDKTTYQAEVLGVTGKKDGTGGRSSTVKKSGSISKDEEDNEEESGEEDVVGIIDQIINYLSSEGKKLCE